MKSHLKTAIFEIPMELSKGYRPEFKKKIGESYQNLITKCWLKNQSDGFSILDFFEAWMFFWID